VDFCFQARSLTVSAVHPRTSMESMYLAQTRGSRVPRSFLSLSSLSHTHSLTHTHPSISSVFLHHTYTHTHTHNTQQHEVFKKIALPAIEDHVTEKYTSNVTSIHMGKLDPKAERKRVQEDIIRRTKMNAKRQNLSAQLTGTLKILADLQNPRAAAVEWLEQELARLKGREGKKKRSQSPQTKFPPEVQTLFEGQIRPSNSEGCFKMLVSEAKEEAKRLGESMGHCMKKYEMLYARFASVKKIENFSGFL